MSGKLYLVTTPIGNLQDITLRALETLKSVDVIAAEDTRRTRQLLTHFDIHSKLISYHAFNEHGKTDGILQMIENGQNIALVSDAGTPSVADPGFYLVRAAKQAGLTVEVIPGVSAVTFSVTASALPVDQFSFWGFVPVKSGRKQQFFEEMKNEKRTVFMFESPYRIAKTLELIKEVLGEDTQIAIIREATKIHEEVITDSVVNIIAKNSDRVWKGEFVIGVYPNQD
ncbi:MAG: 16S rRNA (cytidine(1402)-2'-O)-methyltransferase [Lentisphaeria bacterium]|nr:16S rRNA (cytidine(1402)-2'-O)-methyltransferase [Lentisphaeria bacterium]